MDNSIFYLNELVKSLMSDIEAYQDALRMHAITIPRDKLEEAVRYGFPEDIYSYYMNTYYVKNEAAAEGVINYIKKDFIPYLQNVSFHLQEAMNVELGSASAASVLTNPSSATKPQPPQTTRSVDDLAFRSHQLIEKNKAIEKNNKDLEDALGIKKGPPMSIAEADKQNANPHYKPNQIKYVVDTNGVFVKVRNNQKNEYEFITKEEWMIRGYDPELYNTVPHYSENPDYYYSINCATCAAAYVLRLRGFDVKAKGNPKKQDNLNTWLSDHHSFDIWNNPDGTKASPSRYEDWMKKNNLSKMGPKDYEKFFEEQCKEEGVYIVTVAWKGKGGHATILQRDSDGKLYYVEPQAYDYDITKDGKRSIDYLTQNMRSVQPYDKGIMRVDNKIFDVTKSELFYTE